MKTNVSFMEIENLSVHVDVPDFGTKDVKRKRSKFRIFYLW